MSDEIRINLMEPSAQWPPPYLEKLRKKALKQKKLRLSWGTEKAEVNGVVVRHVGYLRFEPMPRMPTIQKKHRPLCGAMTRAGLPCIARVVLRPDNTLAKRCRLHGGLSTGPRSAEGRKAIAASNRARAK